MKNFIPAFVICAALAAVLAAVLATPARALNSCEKEAGQCNRETDISFRQDKKTLGNSDAFKLADQRRYQCRVALKKCGEVKIRNRDLRLGGGISNSGRLSNPSYSPGN